jgi:DNA ligase-1
VASNKVLLACNKPTKFTDLTYPMFASPKYDGNRLVIRYGELLSRKMKPQPNRYLPKFLKAICDYSSANRIVFDGEFFSQDVHFTDIQSMRAHDWKPPEHFAYHVFDMLDEIEWEGEHQRMLSTRVRRYRKVIQTHKFLHVVAVPQIVVNDWQEAEQLYEAKLADGFEGLILRDPGGGYKHGRSTPRDGLMYKFKQMATIDVKIVGFQQKERMTDDYKNSDRGREEDGSITRTSSKSTRELVPDCIGATQVRLDDGTTCNVCLKRGVSYEALGITWKNRKKFIGRYVEIEYQECGTKDRPRLGRIIRLRPDLDE